MARMSIGEALGVAAQAVTDYVEEDARDDVDYNVLRSFFGLAPVNTDASPDAAFLVDQLTTELTLLQQQIAVAPGLVFSTSRANTIIN